MGGVKTAGYGSSLEAAQHSVSVPNRNDPGLLFTISRSKTMSSRLRIQRAWAIAAVSGDETATGRYGYARTPWGIHYPHSPAQGWCGLFGEADDHRRGLRWWGAAFAEVFRLSCIGIRSGPVGRRRDQPGLRVSAR